MKAVLLSICLFLGYGAYANDFSLHSSEIQQQNWSKLLNIVEHTGKILESPYGDYLFVEHIEPNDTSVAHVANYFSLVGGRDTDGKFHYSRVEVVSEDWQINADGNWQIDQWLFRISPEGQVLSSSRVDMIQTKGRVVLKHESTALDEQTQTIQWQRILNGWYTQIGLD
jgi:hypothetical protein